MAGTHLAQLSEVADIEEAKASSRTLAKYANAERVQLSIKNQEGDSDSLILPGHALQLLLDILSEMSRGNAISVLPVQAQLSTQEAANLLNVSRPFLVGLLDKGEIAHHKVGAHRRVLAQDVLAYKQQIDAQRQASLDELSSLSQELGMGYE